MRRLAFSLYKLVGRSNEKRRLLADPILPRKLTPTWQVPGSAARKWKCGARDQLFDLPATERLVALNMILSSLPASVHLQFRRPPSMASEGFSTSNAIPWPPPMQAEAIP